MNWKYWGKNETAQMTADGFYSIHRGVMGWTAWARVPMKRLSESVPENKAKQLCESHAKQQERP